jgi:streptogramin lyase
MKWLSRNLFIVVILAAIPIQTAEAAPPESSFSSLSVQAEIPRSGHLMGFGFNSLWMESSGDHLVRVDATNNGVTDIHIKGATGAYRSVGIGEGAVWVADCGSKVVYKVDPNANKVVKEISTEFYGCEDVMIAVGEGSLWMITEIGDTTLTRFNAESGAVEANISLPSGSAGIVVDYGSVWVTGYQKSELYRIDPKTNTVRSTISLHRSPRFLASGEGSVWVLTQADGTVQRIDGQTGKLTATIETGVANILGDIATGGGYVWLSLPGVPVAQIDPKTNALIRKFKDGSRIGYVCFGAGSLWLSGASIRRIQPPS